MRVPRHADASSLEVKMTPMIDVVFLLLVFFVWTSSFDLPEYDLPSSIAQPPQGISDTESPAPPSEPFDEIIVRLINDQGITVTQLNGTSVPSLSDLQSQLRQIIELGVQPPVIIDPDGNVTMDHAIEVYDAAKVAGADRVLFAAKADEQP